MEADPSSDDYNIASHGFPWRHFVLGGERSTTQDTNSTGCSSGGTKSQMLKGVTFSKAQILSDRKFKLFISNHTLRNRNKFLNTLLSSIPGRPGSFAFA